MSVNNSYNSYIVYTKVQLIALRPDAIAIDIPAEITKDPEEEQSDEGKELDQDNRIDGVNEYTYMRLLDERMELAESEAHVSNVIYFRRVW